MDLMKKRKAEIMLPEECILEWPDQKVAALTIFAINASLYGDIENATIVDTFANKVTLSLFMNSVTTDQVIRYEDRCYVPENLGLCKEIM